jgi:hypothetical protein
MRCQRVILTRTPNRVNRTLLELFATPFAQWINLLLHALVGISSTGVSTARLKPGIRWASLRQLSTCCKCIRFGRPTPRNMTTTEPEDSLWHVINRMTAAPSSVHIQRCSRARILVPPRHPDHMPGPLTRMCPHRNLLDHKAYRTKPSRERLVRPRGPNR